MKAFHHMYLVGALVCAGVAHAQEAPVDPGTANPVPATSRAEGTAADTTPPGETPVRGTASSQAPEKVTSEWDEKSREQSAGQKGAQEKRMAMADASSDRRASMFEGKGIYSKQGALLGEVKDLVIDPKNGKVTHAIVATGGSVTGSRHSYTAIPWTVVNAGMQDGRIKIDESRLSQAPVFTAGQWPDLRKPEWSREADQHWKSSSVESSR